MIKNIKKGALLNLKMLMASAYSASRFSQSSHCCNCISPTILAILAKVQSQAGKDGKDLQYISAKFNNLDDAAITIIRNTWQHWDLRGAWKSAWNNVECCSPSKLLCILCAWLTAWPVYLDLIVILRCWWSLPSLPTSSQSLCVKDGKDGLQQSLNFTVANHVMTCIGTGT